MRHLVVPIGNGSPNKKKMKFHPLHSPWLRYWLLGAFIVTRNLSSRTLGTLLEAGAIMDTRLPPESLQEVHFLIARRPLINSMPC